MMQQNMSFSLPFKSAALALVFGLFLGPIGLLYSSLAGGVILILMSLFVLRAKLYAIMVLVWLVSCILNVAAANRYNQNLLRIMLKN